MKVLWLILFLFSPFQTVCSQTYTDLNINEGANVELYNTELERGMLEALNDDSLEEAKEAIEKRLEEKSGINFSCEQGPRSCIQAYSKMMNFRKEFWNSEKLAYLKADEFIVSSSWNDSSSWDNVSNTITINSKGSLREIADFLEQRSLVREYLNLSTADQSIKGAVKLNMEFQLRQRAGIPFSCSLTVDQCIEGYQKLLQIRPEDWAGLETRGGKVKRIFMSERNGYSEKGEGLLLNFSSGLDQMFPHLGMSPTAELKDAVKYAIEGMDYVKTEALGVDVDCIPVGGMTPEMIPDPPLPPGRENFYEDLFEDEEFTVTIVKGYRDYYSDEDDHRYDTFLIGIERVTSQQLYNELVAKGFTPDTDNKLSRDYTMSKDFFYKGRKIKAKIRIVSASVTCEGESWYQNESKRDYKGKVCQKQKEATAKALNVFRNSLAVNDLTIYSGHSRYGNGPDFGPYYQKYGKFPIQSGAMETLTIPRNHSALMLNSCSSVDHFKDSVQEASEVQHTNMTLFANDEASKMIDGAKDMVRTIQGLMERKDNPEIAALVNKSRSSFNEANLKPSSHQ